MNKFKFLLFLSMGTVMLIGCMSTISSQTATTTTTEPRESITQTPDLADYTPPPESEDPFLHFDINVLDCTVEPSHDPYLNFEIKLDNENYSANDDIIITLLLTSNSSQEIFVNNRLALVYDTHGEVTVIFKSNDWVGTILGENVGVPEDDDFIVMQKEETYQTQIVIDRIADHCNLGICLIHAFYENEFEPSETNGVMVWKGTLASNTIFFEVKP